MRANGRASGPELASQFMAVLNHCGKAGEKRKGGKSGAKFPSNHIFFVEPRTEPREMETGTDLKQSLPF